MRHGSLFGIALFGLAPLALVAGCTQSRGSAFAVPIDKARHVLEGTGLPLFVFGSNEPEVTVRRDGPSRIVWILHNHGAEMMRYVAEVSPEGEGSTRVSLDLVGASQGPYRETAERLAQNGSIRHLYLVAMEEQIASALEDRPFDRSKIVPAMVAATAANIGRLSADVDRIAEADQRRERENIERAYRDEAAGRSR